MSHHLITLGGNVRAARNLVGLTQASLAEAVNKSTETISNIERGRVGPSIDTLVAIAAALGVSSQDLMCGVGIQPDTDPDPSQPR